MPIYTRGHLFLPTVARLGFLLRRNHLGSTVEFSRPDAVASGPLVSLRLRRAALAWGLAAGLGIPVGRAETPMGPADRARNASLPLARFIDGTVFERLTGFGIRPWHVEDVRFEACAVILPVPPEVLLMDWEGKTVRERICRPQVHVTARPLVPESGAHESQGISASFHVLYDDFSTLDAVESGAILRAEMDFRSSLSAAILARTGVRAAEVDTLELKTWLERSHGATARAALEKLRVRALPLPSEEATSHERVALSFAFKGNPRAVSWHRFSRAAIHVVEPPEVGALHRKGTMFIAQSPWQLVASHGCGSPAAFPVEAERRPRTLGRPEGICMRRWKRIASEAPNPSSPRRGVGAFGDFQPPPPSNVVPFSVK